MAIGIVSYHTDSDRARMRNEVRQQIVSKLTNKEYRDIFVSEQINTGLAFQIRAMREQRGWTQAELGDKAGMAQSRVSIMEDANYSRFSLTTLKRLASAFDVALTVRFEPFSKLVDHFVDLDSSSLNVPGFDHDAFAAEIPLSGNWITFGQSFLENIGKGNVCVIPTGVVEDYVNMKTLSADAVFVDPPYQVKYNYEQVDAPIPPNPMYVHPQRLEA